jgi:ABC-2 type transport system permease protein
MGCSTLALTLFPPLLAGLATAKEKEQGTILQVYASSLTGSEYLLGKAAAFWLVGMAEVLLVNLAAWVCFGLWFTGDPTPIMIGSLFYIACGVFWGIFLGTVTGAQSAVILAVTITAFLLSLLMSGFIYPVANIPIGLRWLANLVPAQSYMPLTRDAYARGMGWSNTWASVLTLMGLSAFFFGITWRKLQRMQVT